MHPNRPVAGASTAFVSPTQVPPQTLLRPEPLLQAVQVFAVVLFVLLLLPFISIAGLLRGLFLLIDLGALAYLTFGPRQV